MMLRILLLAIYIFTILTCSAQEIQSLFKAKSFSEAFFNPVYQELKKRQENNGYLNKNEKKWLEAYQEYLDNYFTLLNNNQQNLFHEQRSSIAFSKTDSSTTKSITANNFTYNDDNKKLERDNELLLGHILFSGVSGIVYGVQINYLIDGDGAGLPLLISGSSMLATIFLPQYNEITSNSLWLRIHGKAMGGIYGYFLAGTAFGDDIFENNHGRHIGIETDRNKKPIAIASSLLGSIALGHLGLHYGKTKPWTDGRIATYQYYSYALPTLACGLLFAFTEDAEFQAYSALITTGVPLGYIAGHRVANKLSLTRGDINAITNNTALGAAIGGSILIYTEPSNRSTILIPIGTALAGSVVGHYTFRNFHITRLEARRLNYATIGGALIGMGISIMAGPENEGTYLLVPSIFGAIGYSALLGYYKNQPRFTEKKATNNNFSFSLHPESLLLNKELPAMHKAPLFSMHWTL